MLGRINCSLVIREWSSFKHLGFSDLLLDGGERKVGAPLIRVRVNTPFQSDLSQTEIKKWREDEALVDNETWSRRELMDE
ncbi:hypothetical protein PPACK8108_LOCUS11023 [Phakopsora pachyrhizi]|uniref:Uncharacterized protein n=1 Tax=Phakopsora pachyrhizi TaxID=170000 RepID=A0AAV0AZD3_PHAPC|nr:hypothetical protein PPACK8108_LOCUS11023 [Phakopsora pachyrhizi]